jgi:hypothetical protein
VLLDDHPQRVGRRREHAEQDRARVPAAARHIHLADDADAIDLSGTKKGLTGHLGSRDPQPMTHSPFGRCSERVAAATPYALTRRVYWLFGP